MNLNPGIMSKSVWLTIEVCYNHDNEVKRYLIRNCNWHTVKVFREAVFSAGLMYPHETDTGRWVVVSPWNIRSVEIWKQEKFFKQ